jgi:UPF0755 protein
VLGICVAVLVLVIGGGWYWYQQQLNPSGAPGETVSVDVPGGSTLGDIANILDSAGVVPNGTVFHLYASRKHAGPFQAGTYRLQRNSDVNLVLAVLAKGPTTPLAKPTTKVTIPEGFTIRQIIDRIHARVPRISVAELQTALDQGKVPSRLKPPGTKSYEGLLFPATYEVTDQESGVDVLTRMAEEMETRVGDLGIETARQHIATRWGLNLTAYDMLKVASMIQFEAAVPQDAPKIAAVTYNRLAKGTPLGFDSTSIYEATLLGKKQPDFTADTPYNTRLNTGLPPTPIAAPGAYALVGAMQPADGPWLYFVLTGPKQVTFATTYNDFLKAKALCRQRGLGCG